MGMASLKFSIVIPLWNKEREIERAINSVLRQNYPNFELIVIDDGSTDKGPMIVSEIKDPRVKLFRQANSGVSCARNRGVQRASGELVAFLDADDAWRPDFLEIILRLREAHLEAGAYATAYEIITEGGDKITPRFHSIPAAPWEGLIPSYFRAALRSSSPIGTSAVAIPKSVFSLVGKFRPGIHLAEDKDLWERIALRFPIAYSTMTGITCYQNSRNRLSKIYYGRMFDRPFINEALEAIARGKVSKTMEKDLQDYVSALQLIIAKKYIAFAGRPDIARKYILASFPRTFRLKIQRFGLYICSLFPGNWTANAYSYFRVLKPK